jgi:hypothetical protein
MAQPGYKDGSGSDSTLYAAQEEVARPPRLLTRNL